MIYDNRMDDETGKPRPPVMYTIQQIAAAKPIAYIVVTATPPPPPPPPVDWQAKYEKLISGIEATLSAS